MLNCHDGGLSVSSEHSSQGQPLVPEEGHALCGRCDQDFEVKDMMKSRLKNKSVKSTYACVFVD